MTNVIPNELTKTDTFSCEQLSLIREFATSELASSDTKDIADLNKHHMVCERLLMKTCILLEEC